MRDNNFDEKKDKKREKLVVILSLLLVILISLGASAWSIFFDKSHATITPEYALVPEDKGAKKIAGEDTSQEKLSHPEGGGSVGISCSPEVKIDRSEKKATLMLQNPSRSNSDMVVRLVIQDTVLAESGKLVPGKEIDSMEISEEAANKLQLGTYEGTFSISLYDHDTGEKAMMESSVNVQVEIRD